MSGNPPRLPSSVRAHLAQIAHDYLWLVATTTQPLLPAPATYVMPEGALLRRQAG